MLLPRSCSRGSPMPINFEHFRRRRRERESVPIRSCLRKQPSSLRSSLSDCSNSDNTTDTVGTASDRLAPRIRKVHFADEAMVYPLTYGRSGSIRNLMAPARRDNRGNADQLWWSAEELQQLKEQNGKVNPVKHEHLVKSLKVFKQLEKNTSTKDDDTLLQPYSSWDDSYGEIDVSSTSQAVLDLLYDESDNSNIYLECRGLDNWGKVSGRADQYQSFMIAYSKQMREAEIKDPEKKLRQKSLLMTRQSRQWAYALGRADMLVASN